MEGRGGSVVNVVALHPKDRGSNPGRTRVTCKYVNTLYKVDPPTVLEENGNKREFMQLYQLLSPRKIDTVSVLRVLFHYSSPFQNICDD